MGNNLDVRLEDGSVATIQGLGQFAQGGFNGSAAAGVNIVMPTGLAPLPGHSFGLQVTTQVNDAVTPASAVNVDVLTIKNSAGTVSVSGALVNVAKSGTAALIAGAFAVSYSFVANLLVITVTPPSGYGEPLNATAQVNIVNA